MSEPRVVSPAGLILVPREGPGHYRYWGEAQPDSKAWAAPHVHEVLLQVSAAWAGKVLPTGDPPPKFGIGDLSLPDGQSPPPHQSHQEGLRMDGRPLRRDGAHLPVTVQDPEYDRDLTRHLLELFRETGLVRSILFSDDVFVTAGLCRNFPGHHNHWHVAFRPNP